MIIPMPDINMIMRKSRSAGKLRQIFRWIGSKRPPDGSLIKRQPFSFTACAVPEADAPFVCFQRWDMKRSGASAALTAIPDKQKGKNTRNNDRSKGKNWTG